MIQSGANPTLHTLALPSRFLTGMVFGREQVGEIEESDIDTMFNTNVLGLIVSILSPDFEV